ncbi:protein NPGR1-like isoform X2 [Lotus japonicus]|uniref:protein NPGR1-like isoform X2 n=1 Tax=Lotus japonicus TaxID=34305 RepID=UPI00258393E2|nr:protein NPGR1-like isoform X2 [Lotus japonicus]
MLCACSGEQFKLEEPPPRSPESLATRDFSASGLSSRTADWDSKFSETQVEEAETTLKEALSLNYEEARALLGRLEYQRGNYDASLQVFQGIDIKGLTPRMINVIAERTKQRKPRSKADVVILPNVMSLHSVSLLLEAILLKALSLEELGRYVDAAKECGIILDTVESALPNGMPEGISEDCKLQEMFHRALELLPSLWIKAGFLDEAVTAYRRALVKPWNLEQQRLAVIQKDLATTLLYGGVELSLPSRFQVWGQKAPKSNIEEAILLLLIIMSKMTMQVIEWDAEIMDHLTFALSVTGMLELLADHVEQILPGTYNRVDRWYFLALCYSAAGHNETALNLLRKACSRSEAKLRPHFHSFLLGAKLCSQDPCHAHEGINFSREVIDLAKHRNKHFLGQGQKFLGVCYGAAARISVLDCERSVFQSESLNFLNCAAVSGNGDPEVIFSLGLENAIQRNLDAAYDNIMMYSNMTVGGSGRGWQLLALIVSAQKRLMDAETIVDFALDEAGRRDQLELLRLKAVLQIAQQQPNQALESYRILLALIQAKKELWLRDKDFDQAKAFRHEILTERKFEMEAWTDLATIYADIGSFLDAKACVDKAQLIDFFSPRSWHITGVLLESQSLYKEAFVSFSVSLSIEPDYIPSIISSAKLLLKLGMQSLPIARSFLMNALRIEPENHDVWFNLGLVSKSEGSLQQAADYFQAAYELKLSAPVQKFE